MEPLKGESNYLVLATSGDVFELSADNAEAVEAAYFSLEQNIVIDIDADQRAAGLELSRARACALAAGTLRLML